jgi:tetraacyldisaccharide 4'-kinase
MLIKQFIVDIIRGEKSVFLSFIVQTPLLIVSFFYRAIVVLRQYFYDIGLFKSYDAGINVISVGNIVAGGSGKTPYVISLAKKYSQNEKVAIILRGYGGTNEKRGTPLEVTLGTSFIEAGDEAVLIKRHLNEAIVIVSKDRLKGACLAKSLGASIVLLDDGFQHRRLKRSFDIVLIDASNPFGFNHFLPRGFLRQSPKALKRADKVVINGRSSDLESTIRKLTNAPIEYIKNEVSGFYDKNDQLVPWLPKLQKVALFSGIGNPKRFLNTIKALGLDVVDEYKALDHKLPSLENLAKFAEQAKKKGALSLLCTEKDRVKITDQINLALPLLWVGITCKGD